MAPLRPEWPAQIGIDPTSLARRPFGDVPVWTARADGWFKPWARDTPSDHEIDCLKSGNLISSPRGQLSCAEIEVVRRFRAVGWEAWWMATCGRRNRHWRPFMAYASRPKKSKVEPLRLLPPGIARVALAGGATGIPDVIAWDPADPVVVFVELKGPKDRSTGEARWISEAKRTRLVRARDVLCLYWSFRD